MFHFRAGTWPPFKSEHLCLLLVEETADHVRQRTSRSELLLLHSRFGRKWPGQPFDTRMQSVMNVMYFFADDTKFSRNWHNPYHDATKSLGLAHFDEIAGDSRQKVRELSPSIAVSMVLCLSLFYHFARITNLGFGDPVPVFQNGKYAPQMVAGSEMRKVDFFLDDARLDFTTQMAIGRSQALRRCGNCIIENALNLSEWRLFLLVANYIPFQSWPQGICEKRQARL